MKNMFKEFLSNFKEYIDYLMKVDFRELLKCLANIFHCRIEMRQISEREATGIIGGVGTCGQEFCCTKRIRSTSEVGIKMAKNTRRCVKWIIIQLLVLLKIKEKKLN